MLRPRALLSMLLVWAAVSADEARAEDVDLFKSIDEQRARNRRQQVGRDQLPPLAGAEARPGLRDGVYDPPRDGNGATRSPPGPIAATTIEREALPPLGEPVPAGGNADTRPSPVVDARPSPVARSPGLPGDVWQGVEFDEVAKYVATLDLPARSPTLAGLWRRIWATEPSGKDRAKMSALRIEALYRSGLLKDIKATQTAAVPGDAVTRGLTARALVGAGDQERGCAEAKALSRMADAPKPLRAEMLLLTGYCAAVAGNLAAAELAADLARGEDVKAPFALAMLDAAVIGQTVKPALPKRIGLIDYRFLTLSKSAPGVRELLDHAEPALAVAIAELDDVDPASRIAAAEVAAQTGSITASRLAEIYRQAPAGDTGGPDAALRRARLFKAVEAERTPFKKTRLIRQLIDDAARAKLAVPVAASLAAATAKLVPVQEIGWFAETAVEINLAAGDYEAARKWVEASERSGGEGLRHWLALIDLADPEWRGKRGEGLSEVERVALRGRLSSDLQHRLVTVLDANDYLIPIPLWEAASKTPQPTTGHLPPTGVLTQLQDAAKKREVARTVILAMATLGSGAADAANIIALGDTIRALRRAGLEPEARRLALEAVLPEWPRQSGR